MFFLNYSNLIDPLLRPVRLCALRFSGLKPRETVLDVCCGTGDQAYHYARAGLVATGVDLDPAMLRLAGKDRRRRTLDNVSFLMADARHLPFPDGSFDGASISFALHEKERNARGDVISEMKRVVRPGGTLVFIDYHVPPPRGPVSRLVRVAELIAGRRHYNCFQDYLEQGGLDALLPLNRLAVSRRSCLNGGLIAIRKAPNP